ncbi:MAG TPA: hypothetical protein PKD45_00010 [Flavobacteriales bacterium]|nr:hypothetical protein [Flavobacteriales bacterium]
MKARPPRRSRLLWWFIAGPLVALLSTTLWAWPYLAVTGTTGAKVLVVEGWLDPGAMAEAAQLIGDSSYTQIYTTGTVRPFAYLLSNGEGIAVDLEGPEEGKIEVEATGLPGSGFFLISGADTLLNEPVTAEMYVFPVVAATNGHLHLQSWGSPGSGMAQQIFVRSMTLGGRNIHQLQRRTWFTRPGDVSLPAWPTYAQSARSELIGLGVPAAAITAVPAYGSPRSRSWGNAHAFGIQARIDGVEAFDVASLGVHARRSHKLFQTAVGKGVQVGVIALTDPYCTRANWWKSFRGWFTVLKEVMGAPEAEVVELKRKGWDRQNGG